MFETALSLLLALQSTTTGGEQSSDALSSDSAVIAEAKILLERDLKDAGSALYRDVHVSKRPGGPFVCGEYNAKNSYGGYTGIQKFFVVVESGSVFSESAASKAAAEYLLLWNHLCAKEAAP